MAWWMRPPPSRRCAISNALPSLAEQVLGRHAHVLVADVRVVRSRRPNASRRDGRCPGARGCPGRVVGTRNIDMPWYALHVGIRHGHHDDEDAATQVRREELVAVDDPLVAVADGVAAELGRVGAAVRLGHRVVTRILRRRAAAAATSPSARACRSTAMISALPVSGVPAQPKTIGAQLRAAEQLVHQRELDLRRSPAHRARARGGTPRGRGRAPLASAG